MKTMKILLLFYVLLFSLSTATASQLVLLRGEDISSLRQFHDSVARELRLSSYYGSNLDALYDVLTEIDQETVIEISGERHLKEVLGAEMFSRVIEVLREADRENPYLRIVFR